MKDRKYDCLILPSVFLKLIHRWVYYQNTQKRLKNMIWNSIDKSWYKSANGSIPNNYPGRTIEYIQKTKKVDFSDFILK